MIKTSPKPVRLFFFWAGIIATVAYRIIVVLNYYSPLWVKIAWYIGTIGFVLYFWHRFRIAKKRADLIRDYNLLEAVNNCSLKKKQKEALSYLVKTSLTSKSRWNSGLIFILSVAALILGIILDILQL